MGMKKHRSTEVDMFPPKDIPNITRYICKSCNTGWGQNTRPKYCPNCGRKVHRVYDLSKDPLWMAFDILQKGHGNNEKRECRMTDREKHIKNLSYIMDSMPDDTCGDWRDSLAYAISSLKTDEAYQLMYEGEEIYTKADMVAILTEIQLEIKELWDNRYDVWLDNQYYIGKSDTLEEVDEVIQQKIDKLKEEVNGKDSV